MASLEPGEVHEYFAEDIDRAANHLESREAVTAEAAQAFDEALNALRTAEAAEAAARSDLAALRNTDISAIEASDEDIDSHAVLTATMAAKGKSDIEIGSYFSHIDGIEEEKQPIVIVASAENIGIGGLKVVYGLTPGHSAKTSADKSNRVRFPKAGEAAGLRNVVVPVTQRRGFDIERRHRGGVINVFAKKAADPSVEPIISNPHHDFEEVHFAGSADEVRDIVDSVAPDDKMTTDQIAIGSLGLPTMVAYGEDAVIELSARIREKDARFKVLTRRCLEGLGIDLSDIIMPGEEELLKAQKKGYCEEFHDALAGALRYSLDPGDGQRVISERLAFWGPLQKAIDYSPIAVLEEIEESLPAFYSRDKRYVITRDNSSPTAVEEEIACLVQRAEDFGVQAASNGSSIREAASAVKKREIYRALQRTPRRKLITRSRLYHALEEA